MYVFVSMNFIFKKVYLKYSEINPLHTPTEIYVLWNVS